MVKKRQLVKETVFSVASLVFRSCIFSHSCITSSSNTIVTKNEGTYEYRLLNLFISSAITVPGIYCISKRAIEQMPQLVKFFVHRREWNYLNY